MNQTLHSYLRQGAQRFPENEAVRFSGESLTYRQLDRASNQVARALLNAGLQRGDRVGIHLPKSIEAVKAFYGTLKAGGVFVPLDPVAPAVRVQRMIDDCQISHLVTNDRLVSKLDRCFGNDRSIVWILGLNSAADKSIPSIHWGDVNRLSGDDPGVDVRGSDLSYIFYTSGTTGEPKGMLHTHESGLAFADWAADEFALVETDRVASHAPLHFDLMVFDYFSTARAGACSVIVPEAHAKLPASLLDLLDEEGITCMYLVPTALTQMLLRGNLEGHLLESMRWIIFGGEVFPTRYLAAWMRHLPDVRFTNVYGVTECNVCTYSHVSGPPSDLPAELPLGRCLPVVEARLVDPKDSFTETSSEGELLVAGPTVMQEYWNRPDETARSFVVLDNGRRFLRTGDIVKRLGDGDLVFQGRVDRQIKMRGNRVQLQDVERAIRSYASIEEAAVMSTESDEGSAHILAVVVNQKPLPADDFSAHLRKFLPWYAVPQEVLVTTIIPRTSAGKIDMQELKIRVTSGTMDSIQTIKP